MIVLDVVLAGESGLDLCRALKSDLRTASIPIVLLSGLDRPGAGDATEAGADAFLPKPFSPLQLLGLVERLAEGSAATRSPRRRSTGATTRS